MSNRTRRRSCWAIGVIVCAVLAILAGVYWHSGQNARLWEKIRQARARGDHARTFHLATELLEIDPGSVEARRAIVDSAVALGRIDDASEQLRWFESAGTLTGSDCYVLGEASLKAGNATAAENYFNQALQLAPDLHAARSRLIYLLDLQCRTSEASEQRHQLLRQGVWRTEDLLRLAKPEDLIESPDVDFLLEHEPDNANLLVAKARREKLQNHLGRADAWLQQALDAQPNLLQAHAERGLLLLEQPGWQQALADWRRELPEKATDNRDLWIVYGMWARQQGDAEAAVRCFGEALLLDPDHRLATHQLGMALSALGEESAASRLAARVTLLDELARATDDIYDTEDRLSHWVRGAESLESLGRLLEAAAWYSTIAEMAPDQPEFRDKAGQLRDRLAADASSTAAESNPLAGLDLENYPYPSFVETQPKLPSGLPEKTHAIRFTDVADAAGLEFAFIGADQPAQRPRRIFEIFGAGVAVLDYDLDGWPDVYAAQGAPLARPGGAVPSDQFFRNDNGSRFTRITDQASLREVEFSQGVSAGDFNNDGFPDLLVANVGENRLFENNGDGTFSDATQAAGLAGSHWTSSCAIADLNGDAWPDLYEVNYLGGPSLLTVRCDDPQQPSVSCRPRDFPSEGDRFFLSLGDGRFAEATTESGFVAAEGKGLGIVIADFAGDGRLGVFVANDTTANHYYHNRAARGQTPEFEERAALAGLAFDRNGLTQAGMGVAADDFDADGRLDLFVTNFADESNTLYRSLGDGYFDDASRSAGLHLPSLSALGFGTQFLDADLDGDPDLVVANGHITSRQVQRFQMQPQFFENRSGAYTERLGSEVGPYFDRQLLGRALARIDFNRDGREDFLVSHLDAPLALLKNESPQPGHYLAVRLAGVASDRDAIGTSVTVITADEKQHVRQLTAGDGYQCSNQRQLVFGLGTVTTISRLHVRWPSGLEQEYRNIAADCELLIVEGRGDAIELD